MYGLSCEIEVVWRYARIPISFFAFFGKGLKSCLFFMLYCSGFRILYGMTKPEGNRNMTFIRHS